jgi:hypothetical protein
MRACAIGVLSAVVLAAVGSGCGGNDLVVGGMLPPTIALTVTASCTNTGGLCSVDADCCSGLTCQTDINGQDICQ